MEGIPSQVIRVQLLILAHEEVVAFEFPQTQELGCLNNPYWLYCKVTKNQILTKMILNQPYLLPKDRDWPTLVKMNHQHHG